MQLVHQLAHLSSLLLKSKILNIFQLDRFLFPISLKFPLSARKSVFFIVSISLKIGARISRKDQEMPSSLQLHRINYINHGAGAGASCGAVSQTKPTWVMPVSDEVLLPEAALHNHTHAVGPNQCCSAAVRAIDAPVETVWSVVRRFDKPQAYKHFLKSCHVILGDGEVGTLREVLVVSGLPAASSTERLEILDDEMHVLSFSVVGGDHRLHNYRSVTTLHAAATPVGGGGDGGTLVVESYVVDIPLGNTKEETCAFVDTIVRCNLQSLAQISENLAKN